MNITPEILKAALDNYAASMEFPEDIYWDYETGIIDGYFNLMVLADYINKEAEKLGNNSR